MKNWLLAAVAALCIGTCAVGFAACGKDNGTSTEHNFSSAWTWDENNHWHACTDEGCTQRSGTSPHVYGDDDECDVCHYIRPPVHEHTWEARFDETNHWQETTCTDHAPEKKDVVAHSYNSAGECSCGLKQVEAQVYAVYKSYTLSKEETVLSYTDWLDDLKENDVTGVELNLAGDGVLQYADKDDEVAYFKTRTIKVQASKPDGPIIDYWVKISVTKDGETTVLDLQKPKAGEFDTTLTFTPVGYTSDTLTYTIAIADEADLDGEEPYHVDYVPYGDTSVAYTVNEIIPEGDYAAEFTFREAISLTHDVLIEDPGASTDGSAFSVTPFKNVPAGTYKLTFSKNAQSSFDSWLVDRQGFRISVVVNTAVNWNQVYYTVYAQKFNIAEDESYAYTYLNLTQSELDADVTIRMGTTRGRVSFTMHLEAFDPKVEEADGEPIEIATLPDRLLFDYDERQCGIDISALGEGTYIASIAECEGERLYVSTVPNYLIAAVDDTAPLNLESLGGHTLIFKVPAGGAEKLYIYSNAGRTNGSTNICMLTVHKVKTLGDEAVSFTNGEAYYKLPLEDGTNDYLLQLTASASIAGLRVSQAYEYYYVSTPTSIVRSDPIVSLNRGGSYNHYATLFEATKSATLDCLYIYLQAPEGAAISDLKLKAEKYDPTAGTLSKDSTSLELSKDNLAATYTYTPSAAGNFVFAVQSESDISGLTILKDGEAYIEASNVATNGIFRVIECKDTTPVTLTFLHGGTAYPTVKISVSAPTELTGGKTLTENEADSAALSATNFAAVYTFTPTQKGLHYLDIQGDGANNVTVYKGAEAIITPAETASSYVSNCDTDLKSGTAYTYVVLYGGTEEATLSVTMHSLSGADALEANTDTTPSLGATAHIKYYTYTPNATGDYWVEIVGESVKDYAVYDVATGNAIITKVADSAKFAYGVWFKQSNTSYSEKSIAVVYYGDTEESITLKLHTASGATAESAGTAFDVEYTAEANSWHVQYVNITAPSAGQYLLTVAASGDGTLAGLTIYEDGTSTPIRIFEAESVAVAYVTERTAASNVLAFVYGGAEALTLSVDLIAKNDAGDALTFTAQTQPSTSAEFGTAPDARVKFYTFTPEEAGNYQIAIATTAEAALYRLGVYVYEGSTSTAAMDARPEDTTLLQSYAGGGFAAKVETTYTICIVWTGEGNLTCKLGIGRRIDAPNAQLDLTFGQNYITWQDVDEATHYIVQWQNGTNWEDMQTYDAETGKGIYDRFVYELTANGNYKVIAQRRSGNDVISQSEKRLNGLTMTAGKLILNITTPEAWEGHTITVKFTCYNGSGTLSENKNGSVQRTLALPAGAHEWTTTFYPKSGYTTNKYRVTNTSTIDGWGSVYSGETGYVKLSSSTPYTTNLELKQKATYTVTVKAPQGYVNSSVKVSLMNGSSTTVSGTVAFTGEGEGEQSQDVVLSALPREYTIAVNFGNKMDGIVEEDLTINTEGEELTAAKTITIKEYVDHKVTLQLPEGYEGEGELTVGLFLSGTEAKDMTTANALLTQKVTPESGATTAEVTFKAAWGNTYVAAVTEGFAEPYMAAASTEMTAASAEETAAGTITVETKPKLVLVFKHDAVQTSGSISVYVVDGSKMLDKTIEIAAGTTETRVEVFISSQSGSIMFISCTIDGATYKADNPMPQYTLEEGQKEVTVTFELTKKA